MAHLLIFGASRGTGAAVLAYAQQQGHQCTVVIRDKAQAEALIKQGISVFVGDANDAGLVEQACLKVGRQATIISTMGGSKANYQAQMNVIKQAEKAGISRMIMVTSLGCGDSWPTLSERAKQAFGLAVREKTLAEVWLQTSELDFCILRPGGLRDGEPTHRATAYINQEVHGFVMRTDLALLILAQVSQASLGHQIFSVIDPDLDAVRNR
ncbi:NAD(P)H-binding protein [Utexia brackfieldae]|uniref:NAD(P)H-binding protein n=1 Tax=Utexia brackfieldae TaxID=3074108 RepID=UPI00370DC80C